METFSALLALCVRGIHWSPVDSPHKAHWRGALMFSLICAWTNVWENNRDAGVLRRHRANYDVTVKAVRTGLIITSHMFELNKWLIHTIKSVLFQAISPCVRSALLVFTNIVNAILHELWRLMNTQHSNLNTCCIWISYSWRSRPRFNETLEIFPPGIVKSPRAWDLMTKLGTSLGNSGFIHSVVAEMPAKFQRHMENINHDPAH